MTKGRLHKYISKLKKLESNWQGWVFRILVTGGLTILLATQLWAAIGRIS
jgi:hypothetical protein